MVAIDVPTPGTTMSGQFSMCGWAYDHSAVSSVQVTVDGVVGVLRDALQVLFRTHRVAAMVFPPTLTPPLIIGEDSETIIRGQNVSVRTAMARNAALASCAGMPALVLPAGVTNDGLPVALEIDMLRGQDRQLLALGLSLERGVGHIPPPFERI